MLSTGTSVASSSEKYGHLMTSWAFPCLEASNPLLAQRPRMNIMLLGLRQFGAGCYYRTYGQTQEMAVLESWAGASPAFCLQVGVDQCG